MLGSSLMDGNTQGGSENVGSTNKNGDTRGYIHIYITIDMGKLNS